MELSCTQKCCTHYLTGSSGQVTPPLATVLLIAFWSWEHVKEHFDLRDWLFTAVIFIATARQRMISASSWLVQQATHQVACCQSLAVPVHGVPVPVEWSSRMLVGTFPWIWQMSPSRCAASWNWREVLVWSSKLWWECTRYAPSKYAQTGIPRQGWWGAKGCCLFPANAVCRESCSPFVISSCYLYPYRLLSVAVLVQHQHRFGHQGPNPLTMRFVSTLPNRATLSSAILCGLGLTYFDAMIHDTCLSYTSEMQAPASSHSADHR